MIITKEIYRESIKCVKKAYLMGNTNYKEDINDEIIENYNDFKNLVIEFLKEKNIKTNIKLKFENCIATIDILEETNNGYNLYEIKSSRHITENYLIDISYQYYVASKNMNINKVYLVIPKEYTRINELEPEKLINIIDYTDNLLDVKINNITLNNNKKINENCKEKSLYCPFFKECIKDLDKYNIFIYSGLQFKDKIKYYNMGIRNKKDIINYPIKNLHREELESKVVKTKKIKEFLDNIKYPLYYLDFETISYLVPKYHNHKSNEKIVIQYSLHIKNEDGNLIHKEVLENCSSDPRYKIAKKLTEDIPENANIMVYHKAFENGIIEGLAKKFPEFKKHLMSYKYIDLEDVFKRKDYYLEEFMGSSSIKYVLPAMFPDDDELNYKKFKYIHNGLEAASYLRKEKYDDNIRKNLLDYCFLDTLAMVKIHEKLIKEVKTYID